MSRAFQLLFEIYNPYFHLYEAGVEVRKVNKEINHGNWIERHELWDPGCKDDMVTVQSAYSPDGAYIGDIKTVKMLTKKGITQFGSISGKVCNIGFNPDENKWYGWSHRAIYGFGIGSKVKKGDCGYNSNKGAWTAKTLGDAKQMAINFAKDVS